LTNKPPVPWGLIRIHRIQYNTNINDKRDGRQPIYHRCRGNDLIDVALLETIADEYEEGDSDIEID